MNALITLLKDWLRAGVARVAKSLRYLADHLDPLGSPRVTGYTKTDHLLGDPLRWFVANWMETKPELYHKDAAIALVLKQALYFADALDRDIDLSTQMARETHRAELQKRLDEVRDVLSKVKIPPMGSIPEPKPTQMPYAGAGTKFNTLLGEAISRVGDAITIELFGSPQQKATLHAWMDENRRSNS